MTTPFSHIIQGYTREAGVRNLEREIASICRKVARNVVKKSRELSATDYTRCHHGVFGVPKYRKGKFEEGNEIGYASGLAWTEFGGEVLTTEASLMDGKGKLMLTGKLGDVMQESAQAAMSYVRSQGQSPGNSS